VDGGEVVIGGGEDEATAELKVAGSAGGLADLGVGCAGAEDGKSDGCGEAAQAVCNTVSGVAMRENCSPGRRLAHPSLLRGKTLT
jgi:hypothetical protein